MNLNDQEMIVLRKQGLSTKGKNFTLEMPSTKRLISRPGQPSEMPTN